MAEKFNATAPLAEASLNVTLSRLKNVFAPASQFGVVFKSQAPGPDQIIVPGAPVTTNSTLPGEVVVSNAKVCRVGVGNPVSDRFAAPPVTDVPPLIKVYVPVAIGFSRLI